MSHPDKRYRSEEISPGALRAFCQADLCDNQRCSSTPRPRRGTPTSSLSQNNRLDIFPVRVITMNVITPITNVCSPPCWGTCHQDLPFSVDCGLDCAGSARPRCDPNKMQLLKVEQWPMSLSIPAVIISYTHIPEIKALSVRSSVLI